MNNRIKFEFLDKKLQNSEYDWINFYKEEIMIGKARCKIGVKFLIIYSINIFPEYEKNGFAKEIINLWKKEYNEIIADTVRHTAEKFWIKMGFVNNNDGNYIFHK